MPELVTQDRERMPCMEILGGNRAIDRSYAAAGLDVYVYSQPFENSERGGDIYLLTSCASGRISRFLLADVSGHGESASGVASSLRDLMGENVNQISQTRFVEKMNHQFSQLGNDSSFATAVVATFFQPTKSLTVSVAGHPYPIYYSASKNRWFRLDRAKSNGTFENMPFGVIDKTEYPERKIETQVDDMFLLYTDAFIESMTDNVSDRMVGTSGLLELLNEEPGLASSEIIPYLRDRVGSMAERNLLDDDASLLLGHFTKSTTRVKDNLMAPVRLLGNVSDRTGLI